MPDAAPQVPPPIVVISAALAVFLVSLGFAGATLAGTALATHFYTPDSAQGALVVSQLASMILTLGWDMLAGAWIPAAAVIASAVALGAPSRPLHRVFLALWLPYAALSLALQLGLILILPGVVVAALSLALVDPVVRAEGRGLGIVVPGGLRLAAMAGLFVLWSGLSTVWNLGAFYVQQQGSLIFVVGSLAYQLAGFGCWLAWCVIARKTAAPAPQGYQAAM